MPYPKRYRDLQADISLRLLDRDGLPLRSVALENSRIGQWTPLEEIPPDLVAAILTAEDKRFYYHFGLDPLAIARASLTNLKARKVLSGASTITQQLLRTLAPPSKRSLGLKLQEAYWAVRAELRLSKASILEAYLNRAAFAPTVYGVQEAARYYFDKPVKSLSLAECALLAVLIRAPSSFDPFSESGREELKLWTDRLLERLASSGQISWDAKKRASQEAWSLSSKPPPFAAAHFCTLLLPQLEGKRGDFYTSLDLELQKKVEGLVANHLKLLNGHHVGNAAAMVVEVASGEVRALVGSADFNRKLDGQFNAATSLRQPGSTVKPFTYALLLDNVGTTGYILPDLPIYSSSHASSYIPENYDKRFRGPVSIRTALASSLNVPAVRALELVGVDRLLSTLKAMGWVDLDEGPEHYGLGLTLGDGSASLWQLVGAYRCLARQGLFSGLSMVAAKKEVSSEQVLSPESCRLITSILSDNQARLSAFARPNPLEFIFPVAVKTGTSKGYRDNWCLGYTPKYVVGVWVGNSDGSPMHNVSGITGAAPLFHDIMLNLSDGGDFSFQGVKTVRTCALSGKQATDICPRYADELCAPSRAYGSCETCLQLLIKGRLETRFKIDPVFTSWAKKNNLALLNDPISTQAEFYLTYPLQGDIFVLDADLPPANQKVRIKAIGGNPPYAWAVDDKELTTTSSPQAWWGLKAGSHTISVVDGLGKKDEIKVHVRTSK